MCSVWRPNCSWARNAVLKKPVLDLLVAEACALGCAPHADGVVFGLRRRDPANRDHCCQGDHHNQARRDETFALRRTGPLGASRAFPNMPIAAYEFDKGCWRLS